MGKASRKPKRSLDRLERDRLLTKRGQTKVAEIVDRDDFLTIHEEAM
jgi:hypothetical protein